MRQVLVWGFGALAAIAVLLALALIFGPREPVDLAWRDPQVPGIEAVEGWLASREAEVPHLRPDAAKTVVWAGAPATRTPLALVYIHGFSAAAPELRPVPDRLAAALGANLFFTRLAGHGRDGAAMAEPTARAWADDLAEAMAVGRVLGERVIVIGTSMGGALSALTALDPAYGQGVAGVAMIAPAFALPEPTGTLLTLPFARTWLPWVIGETRVVAPRNEAQAAAWTLTYPAVSVLPLAALVRQVGAMDKTQATIPAITFYSEADKVVDPAAIRAAAAAWGAPHELVALTMGPGDDASGHVIAGDIVSPGQTETVARRMADWARGL